VPQKLHLKGCFFHRHGVHLKSFDSYQIAVVSYFASAVSWDSGIVLGLLGPQRNNLLGSLAAVGLALVTLDSPIQNSGHQIDRLDSVCRPLLSPEQ
jgi:hypothetical protein